MVWIETTFIQIHSGLPVDDAYIYLKYVQNLIAGHGLCFNSGEVSFGCTSFLYPIVCALIGSIFSFIEPLVIMQFVGIFWFAVLVWMIQVFLHEHTNNLWLSFVGGCVSASCRPFYFTALAGLETSMFLAVFVIVLHMMAKRNPFNPVWLGTVTAVLFLIRPEGLFVAVGYCVFLLYATTILRSSKSVFTLTKAVSETVHFCAGFMTAALPYLIYVFIHTGSFMPSTFYGKLLHHNKFLLYPLTEKIRMGMYAIPDAYQQIQWQDPTPFMFSVMILLSLVSFLIFFFRCGLGLIRHREFAARAIMLSFFFLPFIFGAKFNITPPYGGYFLRYLLPIFVVFHIETFLALHFILTHILTWISSQYIRHVCMTTLSIFVAFSFTFFVYWFCLSRIEQDKQFYSNAVSFNEDIRKKAGLWINENTPESSRILTGTTGLGVVGVFCNRYVKDEAGLINPDIHPFLKQYSLGYSHWESMLEYMKIQHLDYYTYYYHQVLIPPMYERYMSQVAEFEGVAREDSNSSEKSKIAIQHFNPIENYQLTQDFERFAETKDYSEVKRKIVRVQPTRWNRIPVLAVDVREATYEIQYEMLFPDHALLKTGIALDFPPQEFIENETITFEIHVDQQGRYTRETVFSQSIPLSEFAARETYAEFTIDLSKYNNRYRTLVLSTSTTKKQNTGILWSGWVNPTLINSEIQD